MSKLVEKNEKIAEAVVEGYKKIEDGVVGGYKKIEAGVVEGFGKVTDKCVEKLFAKEGENVQEAKERLSSNKQWSNARGNNESKYNIQLQLFCEGK